jgi:hypothetical protein
MILQSGIASHFSRYDFLTSAKYASLYSLATFSYLTDSYEQYGSSAIGKKRSDISPSRLLIQIFISGAVFPPQQFWVCTSGLLYFLLTSLFNRNSGAFPLFADVMYKNLGYPQASSLLAGLAFAFSILPFLLMAYGPRIRRKSRVAKQIAWQQEKRAAQAVRNTKEKEIEQQDV